MEIRKSKMSKTSSDEGYWDCSVCTYSNRPELFKCEMCDVRKGTSTRKPRLTAEVTQQFAKIENQIEQERRKDKRKELLRTKKVTSDTMDYKLKNKQRISITVCGITVYITDYELEQNEKPKQSSDYSKSARSSIESSSHKTDEEDDQNEEDEELGEEQEQGGDDNTHNSEDMEQDENNGSEDTAHDTTNSNNEESHQDSDESYSTVAHSPSQATTNTKTRPQARRNSKPSLKTKPPPRSVSIKTIKKAVKRPTRRRV